MVVSKAKEFYGAYEAETRVLGHNSTRAISYISWKPPDPGWCKINVDGVMDGRTGQAACGGMLRDEKGS